MKITYTIICLCLLVATTGYGQASQSTTARQDVVLDKQFGIVTQTPPKAVETVGSVYFNDTWCKADVYLKKGAAPVSKMLGLNAKLDLNANSLDVSTEAGVKVLDGAKIDSFYLTSSNSTRKTFLACAMFESGKTKKIGFGEVLVDSKVRLLSVRYIVEHKPTYSDPLKVGSNQKQIIQKADLYLVVGNNLSLCNGRTVFKILDDKKSELKKFVNSENLSLKNQDHMARLIQYYNTL